MPTTFPNANLRRGLIGAWCPSLGATGFSLLDRSGNNRHAVIGGNGRFSPNGTGQCLYVDNNSSTGQATVTGVNPQDVQSVSLWCAGPLTYGVASTQIAIGDSTDLGRTAISYSGGGWGVLCSTLGTNCWNASVSTAATISGVMTHVAMTKSNGKCTGFWVNGILLGGPTTSGSLSNGSAFLIGRRFDTSYGHYGWLDDIRIYNRQLTLAEIRLLAFRRGIGLSSVRKRYTLNYPIVTPPNRLYAKALGLWVPGSPKVNKNGFWASYTPTTATYHVDAVDWEARVRANGGTVSVGTLQAVSNFCTEIATAGIRSKLFRVNLFCGDNLQACLVPLYTSPTTGSAPVGGYAVDFNTGFLNSDYMEKGIGTGGLRGNGTAAKKLSTNLCPQDVTANSVTGHIGMYIPPFRLLVPNDTRVDNPVASIVGATRITFDWRNQPGSSAIGLKVSWGTGITGNGTANPFGLMMGDRSSTTRLDMYQQGVSVANGTTANSAMPPMIPYEIFSNQLSNYTSNPLFGYTLGSSLTATEHVAYSAAWNTFQAALSRSV